MIEADIPFFGELRLEHLVLDFNGTLAEDGSLLPGVRETLSALAEKLKVHVLTADTFGKVRHEMAGLPCELIVLGSEEQAQVKANYVERLGASRVVCIGNGRNDKKMLESAALGIMVIQKEGAASECVASSKVLSRSVQEALSLLLNPMRLVATLRG